jgi:hypothetical protein
MEEAIAPSEGKVTRSNLVGAAIKTQSRSRVCRFCAFPTQRLDAYAADFRLRVGGGAISASAAGMPHWRCSFQAIGEGMLPGEDVGCALPRAEQAAKIGLGIAARFHAVPDRI